MEEASVQGGSGLKLEDKKQPNPSTGTSGQTDEIKCPICEFMNPPDQQLCLKCQAVLHIEIDNATGKLPPSPEVAGVAKWGTTYIERKVYLHVRGSNHQPIELTLEEGDFVIGRYDTKSGHSPEVDLEPYGAADKGVSRKHAVLIYRETSLKVSDLNSANFTFLNGFKLVPNQARLLRDGDEIRLGHMVLTVQFGEKTVSM